MRTLKLTLAYEGTRYAGWQNQRGRQPTIQVVLQRAFRRIVHEAVHVVGSGRTDAGVHALAQVAHVKTHSRIAVGALQGALNAILPPDIVVTEIREVSPRFQAQFHATSKRYRYHIVNGSTALPFERRYVHHIRVPLNVSSMKREASVLVGRHDFRAFCASGSSVTDMRRTVHDIHVHGRQGRVMIDLEADGFLYRMVRSIVGTLIDIGRGHRPAGTMARILATKDRRLVGPTAPAKGLWLMEVRY